MTIRSAVIAPTVLVRSDAVLMVDLSNRTQPDWRWCHKCQGLFYSGNPDQGPCPAGGRHDASASGAYLMIFGNGGPNLQPAWRWCHKCQGLFFSGGPDQGHCPAAGSHDATGSGAYLMTFGDGAAGMQPAWRWCHKCQGLFYGGNPDQGACPTGDHHDSTGSGAYLMRFDPNPPPQKFASLPLTDSRSGSLFADRNDPNLHWYLPDFSLTDDVDPTFAFAASQSGQDGSGNPFNKAQLTLQMRKSKPADAVKLSQDNPAASVEEIPLAEMSAVLTSFYNDDAGQQQQRTFKALITDQGNGNFLLTFDSILGQAVIGIYQDLTVFGKAVINLSASFQAWSSAATAPMPARFQIAAADMGIQRMMFVRSASFARMNIGSSLAEPVAKAAISPPATLEQTRQPWTAALPLQLKYKLDGYQLKYTVSTATVTAHVIRDAKDLKDFSLSQSEFVELKALGDVSQRFPTLSRLYMGILSRTIVVVPRRYSIVRSSSGCAATCMALVDSSAGAGSKCKFEFDFTIAPEVSRIEFLKLTQEIQGRDDLKGFTPKLPDFISANPPSTLQTAFKSSADISRGADGKTFAVTVVVQDDGAQTPAVAIANLFIMRVCATDSELVGTLSIKLDDGYTEPVLSTIDLNFAHTVGTDELTAEVEEGTSDIKLTNNSGFDLQLSRYALIKGSQLNEVAGALLLPKNSSAVVPLPAEHDALEFAADSQIVVPKPMSKADVQEFFSFHTADVQETQYVVAVSASGVSFSKVESLQINVTFSTLPTVIPPAFKLSNNHRADSAHILIPLENAVFALTGTVNVTVHFVDPGSSDLEFTLENDFTVTPTLVLVQSDIDKNLPKT